MVIRLRLYNMKSEKTIIIGQGEIRESQQPRSVHTGAQIPTPSYSTELVIDKKRGSMPSIIASSTFHCIGL